MGRPMITTDIPLSCPVSALPKGAAAHEVRIPHTVPMCDIDEILIGKAFAETMLETEQE